MNKLAKWGVSTLAVLMLLAGVVWLNRVEIMLSAIERLSAARSAPAGPNRPVTWEPGPGRAVLPPGERPPNIVLILADDLGWNDLTFAGGGVANGTVPTPNIDSIAAAGVDFTNGYAGNGTCAPSRAAIMSGRYPTRFGFEFTPTPPGMMTALGVMANAMGTRLRPNLPNPDAESVPYEEMGMPASEITLAELLKERGYHTLHIGKWHLGRTNGMAPHEQGFDESLLMASALYLPKDDPNVVNSKQDFDPIDRFLWRALQFSASFNGSETFEPARYLTDYYTDEAVNAIAANKHRPFFLYLAHWAPHTPLQATKADYDALSHIVLHRERVYAAMIRALDRGVGQVLDALRLHGLDDNTLVIFTSDNGGAGYIGLPDVNDPFRGWKITLFEGGIHVPYFMRWPAQIEPDQTIDAPVHHFDIFATVAAAAGARLPSDRTIDGVDLVPIAQGVAKNAPHESLFWRSGASQTALVNGWKLNVSDPPGKEWLFDLRADPTEQNNLAQQRPEKLAELRSALATHNADQQAPAWPSRGSFAVNIDKDLSIPDAPDDEYIYWSN